MGHVGLNPETGLSNPEKSALLRRHPIFRELKSEICDRLAAYAKIKKVAQGATIFAKGDPGNCLFAVCRGAVQMATTSGDGKSAVFNQVGVGEIFGEIALLDGQPRTANAVAAEDCELYVLRRHDFMSFIEREPRVAIRLIELLCQRLRWMNERMEEVALLPLHMRMARRLAGLALDFGTELHLTQGELSEFVGGARESVSRQLQKWRRAGIVDLRRGRIIILDGERLAAEASKANSE